MYHLLHRLSYWRRNRTIAITIHPQLTEICLYHIFRLHSIISKLIFADSCPGNNFYCSCPCHLSHWRKTSYPSKSVCIPFSKKIILMFVCSIRWLSESSLSVVSHTRYFRQGCFTRIAY